METEKRLIDHYADVIPNFIERLAKYMTGASCDARTVIRNVLRKNTRDKTKTKVLNALNMMMKDKVHTFDELYTPIGKLQELNNLKESISSPNP